MPGSVPTLSNPAPQPQTYRSFAPPRPGRLSTRKTQSWTAARKSH